MKKSKRNIIIASTLATFITLSIGSCSNGGGKEKSNYDKRNEYAKYNMSNSEYIDEDIEKFTTFEQMVTYNWYILEINDDGNTDVIITRKTVPSETVRFVIIIKTHLVKKIQYIELIIINQKIIFQ